MQLRFRKEVYPESWASALINDDWSGLDKADREACRSVVDELVKEGWAVVDVERDRSGDPVAPRFTWNGWLYRSPYDGVNVITYVLATLPTR